ncbi:hypothetical protein MMC12_008719, partial [Toensbergia leucococca]|nr:hypothetical protein [Toensbergia leucococca]
MDVFTNNIGSEIGPGSAGSVSNISSSEELIGLQSTKSSNRLNQIDKVRASGVGDHIALPQLIVCGDQSAGKSSVLEGVTGLPFPRQDGVCTKFPTEIILRHSSGAQSINATIIPQTSRSDSSRKTLHAYRKTLLSFQELPDTITEVAELMGIQRSEESTSGPAFAADVLRIEVIGNTGLHLTVVDLPGLIAVANEEQTEEDVQLVGNLIDSYLESPRTIILAVVQANNDIANQGIIQRARRFDKAGERTVGIITKPDLINAGTEGRIALLAKNQDTTKLKLGYFLLKNPSPSQLAIGMTPSQRKQDEENYFRSSTWKKHNLNLSRVGINALKTFLQGLLDRHIEKELPKVREEINLLLSNTERELEVLGADRPTVSHLRTFLSRLSMEFYNLTKSALDGTYHETDSVFFRNDRADGYSTRLRAQTHKHNARFATDMRQYAQKRRVIDSQDRGSDETDESDDLHEITKEKQLLVTRKELMEWVKKVYQDSRGRELPGNYNHILMSELFHEQSSRWQQVAAQHLARMDSETAEFVDEVLLHIVKEDDVRQEIREITNASLQNNLTIAQEELRKLLEDEKRQPITYNHYYTDNIQNARQDATRKLIQKAVEGTAVDWNGKFHVSNTTLDSDKLLASLQKRVVVDMDEQACLEALAGLNAYYKVAMKTFTDN